MIQLRDNQIEPVEKGVTYFKESKSVPSLMVLPTAAGKSIIISQIVKNMNEKVLVLQPSKELLEQNLDKLRKIGGEASVYSASIGEKEIGNITYATIGSIKSLGKTFKNLSIKKLIVDEADRYPKGTSGMIGKFIKDAGITHTLGLTATPLKLHTALNWFTKETESQLKMLTCRTKKGQFYKEIIHVCQIQEMVCKGYWSPLIYEAYKLSTGKLVLNTSKAEFTTESLVESYIKDDIDGKIIKRLQNLDRKSILIFVPSVAEAFSLSYRIPGSQVVHGGTPTKERSQIVSDFKELKIKVVINVNVLGVGFDHPELDCIICGRATASLSWYYQALGRITRIHPDKKDGLIIDFAGNVDRFGKIEDLTFEKENIWKLYGANGKLLSGIPIHEIGKHFKGQITVKSDIISIPESELKFTFGKYEGKYLHEAPSSYLRWMNKEFIFKNDQKQLQTEIKRLTDAIN